MQRKVLLPYGERDYSYGERSNGVAPPCSSLQIASGALPIASDTGDVYLLFEENPRKGESVVRPFPAMLGDGQTVDLFRLYSAVRGKGGYRSVTAAGSWGLVAGETGLDASLGSALKLIYAQYLAAKKKEVKKETGLGLTYKKDDNFGEWYSEKEKDHIEGFAPEVAWVTKSGQSELEVPIAIRPTSETVMYPYYSKWIRGHRDLPLKLNQWCNVVRWEFSNPTPFIRSREFLWQEGHTAFATKSEADQEVLEILELYRRIYEEYLAVPVIKGRKSELEKFAGGLYTTSVEAFIPHAGRGIQGATSHCLGQNFAKMFQITFENENREKAMVWQNSWAYSTRTIGVLVMVHGDDKGLVLPPKVAAVQVIVVPVPYKDADTEAIFAACVSTVNTLTDAGLRAEADLRDNYSPGWKYSHWEMKGVPLRIEIGPKDLANRQVRIVRRDTGDKQDIPMDSLVDKVKEILASVQKTLFEKAKERRDQCIKKIFTWEEFVEALNEKKMILAPWCDEEEVEKDVKTRTKGEPGVAAAKTLCTPFDQPDLPEGTLCFASGKPAKKWTYWGRSY
ncbi:hypothetical protein Taro_017923 [Colocasia esculenta]|uniref:proline--tRNA ligase n=1 Tax=Colocasia esculenta TaxID=4460 RepID=A0A843UHF1_COLES|nr:hypothetical protein [Colocasia esculenta]